MSELRIDVSASIDDYFAGLVEDTLRARSVPATSGATEYLVSLLASYAAPRGEAAPTFETPLTLLLEECELASGAARFERLRTLGDRVLYALGFFGDHLAQRGASRSYVEGVGSDAYARAASMMRASAEGGGDVLRELSRSFRSFAGVIGDIAEGAFASQAKSAGGIVRLYERFLQTGSSRVGAALSAQGIFPQRRSGLA